MIPNNNLSVLPWYTSIEQQNARKWWVYNRIYPLYSYAGIFLPFQIMRNPVRVEWAEMTYYRKDVPLSDGSQALKDGCATKSYDMLTGVTRLYLYDIPAAPIDVTDAVMAVAFDSNGDVVGTFKPIISGTYTGYWDLPADTERVDILSDNSEESAATGYAAANSADPREIMYAELYKADGTLVGSCTQGLIDAGLTIKAYGDIDVIVFPGLFAVYPNLDNGQYYMKMDDGINTWYSEVFTVVNDMSAYLKIEWWDNEDFVMDAGVIVYQQPAYKNILYLPADLAKPEYNFDEEGETRDGYFFPTKQISEKVYKFHFLASEYLLDVMRFIRMSDYINIEYNGQKYSVDTFLITPEWEAEGDVAGVEAEFSTATVAKKIGVGYIRAQRGDFNDDFNNDFNR